jgi:hypothetical protein
MGRFLLVDAAGIGYGQPALKALPKQRKSKMSRMADGACCSQPFAGEVNWRLSVDPS